MTNIIKLSADDDCIYKALQLVIEVFDEFNAPQYSAVGTAHFKKFLLSDFPKALADNSAQMYIYIESSEICGVMAVREKQAGVKHITLAFVKAAYHRKGIGKQLFEHISKLYPNMNFTVNSSPYGVEFYKKLEFIPTGMQQIEDGIIFTPMKKSI